jgi:hypothetical protein
MVRRPAPWAGGGSDHRRSAPGRPSSQRPPRSSPPAGRRSAASTWHRPGTPDLTRRTQSSVDASGPGRKASRTGPLARSAAFSARRGRSAPPAAVRDPRHPRPAAGAGAKGGGHSDPGADSRRIAAPPAVTDLVTAGRALGLGRTKAHELARAGQFPCQVIRAGKAWLVPVVGLLTVLGLPAPARSPSPPRSRGLCVRADGDEAGRRVLAVPRVAHRGRPPGTGYRDGDALGG